MGRGKGFCAEWGRRRQLCEGSSNPRAWLKEHGSHPAAAPGVSEGTQAKREALKAAAWKPHDGNHPQPPVKMQRAGLDLTGSLLHGMEHLGWE